MTIDEMAAELRANGYNNSPSFGERIWFTPDAQIAFVAPYGSDPIEVAYNHMMAMRELAVLRDYVLTVWQNDDYAQAVAGDLISKYNIADESDDDE